MVGLGRTEIAHFRHMLVPDDAAEAGERFSRRICDAHHSTKMILPEQVTAGIGAQFAIKFFCHAASIAPFGRSVLAAVGVCLRNFAYSKTRSMPPLLAAWR